MYLYTIYQHVTFNTLAYVVYGIFSRILLTAFTFSYIFRKPGIITAAATTTTIILALSFWVLSCSAPQRLKNRWK